MILRLMKAQILFSFLILSQLVWVMSFHDPMVSSLLPKVSVSTFPASAQVQAIPYFHLPNANQAYPASLKSLVHCHNPTNLLKDGKELRSSVRRTLPIQPDITN